MTNNYYEQLGFVTAFIPRSETGEIPAFRYEDENLIPALADNFIRALVHTLNYLPSIAQFTKLPLPIRLAHPERESHKRIRHYQRVKKATDARLLADLVLYDKQNGFTGDPHPSIDQLKLMSADLESGDLIAGAVIYLLDATHTLEPSIQIPSRTFKQLQNLGFNSL